MTLRIDYCSHRAMVYACRRWHYSGNVPPIKNVHYGVWEEETFKGVIVYSRGVNRNIGKQYGYDQTSAVELTRVALREHQAPVSQMVAITLRMLQKKEPGLSLIVSYADPLQGHVGTIYQARNWVYVGRSNPTTVYIDHRGRPYHRRALDKHISNGSMEKEDLRHYKKRKTPGKFKYLYPLTEEARERIEPLAKDYPGESDLSDLARRAARA